MKTSMSTKNTKSAGKPKSLLLTGCALGALVMFIPVVWLSCDSSSVWDHLNENLITSRLTIENTSITVQEDSGADGYFYVNMLEKPTDPVIIKLTLTDTSEAYIPMYYDVKDSTEYGRYLEFTPLNWKDKQTVCIINNNDDEIDGRVTFRCKLETISDDTRYNGFNWEPVTITCLDNEIGGYYQYAQSSSPYTSIATDFDGRFIDEYQDNNKHQVPFDDGFQFSFLGQTYTTGVSLSVNGLLFFSSENGTNPLEENNRLFTGTNYDDDPDYAIAPWWDNLIGDDDFDPTAQIYYKLTGTAPSRVLIIEWHNIRLYNYGETNTWVNFQVKLYETSNRIEMHYGDTSASILPTPTPTPTGFPSPTPTPGSASVGMKGLGLSSSGQPRPDYIYGMDGSCSSHRDDLSFAEFPAPETVFVFTPR